MMGYLACAISVVEEDTLHGNAPPVLHHLAYATSVGGGDTLLVNAVLPKLLKEIVKRLLQTEDLVEKLGSTCDTSLHLTIRARSTKGKKSSSKITASVHHEKKTKRWLDYRGSWGFLQREVVHKE